MCRAEESKFKALQHLTSDCHLIVGLLIWTAKTDIGQIHKGDEGNHQKGQVQKCRDRLTQPHGQGGEISLEKNTSSLSPNLQKGP